MQLLLEASMTTLLSILFLSIGCRTSITDKDNDGILEENDCDDNDPLSSNIKEDADCDTVPTNDD